MRLVRSVWLAALAASSIATVNATDLHPQDLGLVVEAQFGSGLGLVSLAYDPSKKRVWAYGGFASSIQSFSRSGKAKSSVARPGEGANDADLDIAPETLTLGATTVPAGSLLFINGESGVAEIHALDPNTGATLATLVTGFGVSHVVGGTYHPKRNSFFLLQDGVPGGLDANRVAEIDPLSGAVLNSFQVSPGFSVNYGDLDVHKASGNLFLASSDEPRLAEFTPTGSLVQYHPLPPGVG